jgi:NAD-dependent SIR2 family protein deacetylase
MTPTRVTNYGTIERGADVRGMLAPVRCRHCSKVYDSADVHVISRYADCDVWTSPCCGRTVDNRLWKSLADITKLGPDGFPEAI